VCYEKQFSFSYFQYVVLTRKFNLQAFITLAKEGWLSKNFMPMHLTPNKAISKLRDLQAFPAFIVQMSGHALRRRPAGPLSTFFEI
jgi:hypothetical protein